MAWEMPPAGPRRVAATCKWSGLLIVLHATAPSFKDTIGKPGNRQDIIDLFWPGKMLAGQKSTGRDLEAACILVCVKFRGDVRVARWPGPRR
jgi:hypothetical protein